jgi:hypothetical protein
MGILPLIIESCHQLFNKTGAADKATPEQLKLMKVKYTISAFHIHD